MSENETSLYNELTSPMSYDEDNSVDTGSGSGETDGTGGSTDTYELYFSLNRTEGINLLHSTSNLSSILSIRYKSNNIEYDATSKYCTYSVISSNTYGYLLKINVKSYSSPIYIHFNGTIVDVNGISWYYPSLNEIVIAVQGGSIISAIRGSSVYSDNKDGFTGSSAADPYRILFGSLMTKTPTPSGQISIHLPSTTGNSYGEAWNTREYGEIEFVGASGNSNNVTCEKVDSDNNCIFNIYMSEEDKTKDITLKFKMVEEPYNEADAVVNLGVSYNHTLVIKYYVFKKTINIYKNNEATDENVVFNVEYRKDAITNEEYTFEDVEADIGFVPFNNITIKSKVNRPIRVRCSLISDPTCFGWVTVDKNSEDGLKLNMISNIVYKPTDITTTNSTGKSIINFSNKSVIKKTFKIPGYKPITLWVDNNTPKLKLYLEREIGVMNEDYSIELTNLPAGTYILKYEDENGNVLTNYDSLTKNYSI